jgi:small ligand-binding sensory domain FIST
MKKPQLTKLIVLGLLSVTFAGCATLTPQKVTQRLEAMNEFELCLAVEAGMDKQTFALDPLIVTGAKEKVAQIKFDCSTKREEIIRFLVRSYREEERRNLDTRMRFGFGLRGGW